MASVYDEVEIEDMVYTAADRTFYYPCPCGDKFFISLVSSRLNEEPRASRSPQRAMPRRALDRGSTRMTQADLGRCVMIWQNSQFGDEEQILAARGRKDVATR